VKILGIAIGGGGSEDWRVRYSHIGLSITLPSSLTRPQVLQAAADHLDGYTDDELDALASSQG
jgi:hypothetical protein